MVQLDNPITSATLRDRDFYAQASKDVYNGKDTEGARLLIEETRREIDAEKAINQLQKELQAKGCRPGCTPRVVSTASNAHWKMVLTKLDTELASGISNPPGQDAVLRLARSWMVDDPRFANVSARLRALNATERVIEFLGASQELRVSQQASAKMSNSTGIIILFVGIALAIYGGVSMDGKLGGLGLILIVVGLGVIANAKSALPPE